MDNPDTDDKTIINVKGVRKPAWEAARRGAAQAGDSMGTWLSDAIDRRISHDATAIEGPANNRGEVGNPDALTPDQLTARIMALAALQQSMAAMKTARMRSSGRGVLATVQASLVQRVIDAEGEPVREIRGKARLRMDDMTVIQND